MNKVTVVETVKIRYGGGRHWHFLDCDLAQDKDFLEVPLMEVLQGRCHPTDDIGAIYKICPGCALRVKGVAFKLKQWGITGVKENGGLQTH